MKISSFFKVMATSVAISSPLALANTIDVLVLYNQGAEQVKGGQDAIETYINHLVATTNSIYRDSEISARLQLVHVEKVSIPEADKVASSGLSALRDNAYVQNLRTQYGADLVTMLSVKNNSCGIGYVISGKDGIINSWSKTYAYSLVAADCNNNSFAHEIGHNMGLRHSRAQGDVGNIFEYGLGYGVDYTFSTIMAYNQVFNASRIDRFSNPRQTDCYDLPCGIPEGDPNSADAVAAIEAVSSQVADFMPSKTNEQSDPATLVPVVNNNLVANPSMEASTSPWKPFFGANLNLDNKHRFTGESSLRASNRPYFYSGVYQDITNRVQVGGEYNISAAMKLGHNGSENGQMAIGINDENGYRYHYFNGIGINGDQWNTIESTFSLKESREIKQVIVAFYGPRVENDLLVDQVNIVPVGGTTNEQSNNLIANGDIESGALSGWYTQYKGKLSISSENPYEGFYSIKTTDRVNWYDGPAQYITQQVEAGKTYRVTGYARLESGTHTVQARVNWVEVDLTRASGTKWADMVIKRVSVGTEWAEVSGTFTMPESDYPFKQVNLIFFGPSPAYNFYLDNVTLEEL